MKLIGTYTESHRILKDQWFLPSIQDNFDLDIRYCEKSGQGEYLEKDWSSAILDKNAHVIQTLQDNWGQIILLADVDIIFLQSVEHLILQYMEGRDIVCQLNDPKGVLCAGFFAARANEATLELWQRTQEATKKEGRNQLAFNRIIRSMPEIRYGIFPETFFGTGTYHAHVWEEGDPFYIPQQAVMFHANWTKGVEKKIALLDYVQQTVAAGKKAVAANNRNFFKKYPWRSLRSRWAVRKLFRQH